MRVALWTNDEGQPPRGTTLHQLVAETEHDPRVDTRRDVNQVTLKLPFLLFTFDLIERRI